MPEAHGELAQLFLHAGAFEKAKTHYESALQLNPAYPQAYSGLATVYARLGDNKKADECRAKSMELWRTGLVQGRERRQAYDDEAASRHALAEEYMRVARLYGRHGKTSQSLEDVRRALALSPGNTEYEQDYAQIRQEM